MLYVQSPMRTVIDSWLPALFCAATITVSLFLLMNYLIQTPEIEIPDIVVKKIPDPVLVDRVIETQKILPPPKVQQIIEPPTLNPPVDIDIIDNSGGYPITGPIEKFKGGDPVEFVPTGAPIARVMIAPEYPHRAVQNGIEGYVVVRFDISVTGATENHEVIEAVPEGVFDKAAMRAISRWKFTPYEVNGEVRPFMGMSKRLTFELDK